LTGEAILGQVSPGYVRLGYVRPGKEIQVRIDQVMQVGPE